MRLVSVSASWRMRKFCMYHRTLRMWPGPAEGEGQEGFQPPPPPPALLLTFKVAPRSLVTGLWCQMGQFESSPFGSRKRADIHYVSSGTGTEIMADMLLGDQAAVSLSLVASFCVKNYFMRKWVKKRNLFVRCVVRRRPSIAVPDASVRRAGIILKLMFIIISYLSCTQMFTCDSHDRIFIS